MINCKETARLSSESHDRSLTLRERVSLRSHLLRCQLCSRYAHQLKFLQDACSSVNEELRVTPNSQMTPEIAFAND